MSLAEIETTSLPNRRRTYKRRVTSRANEAVDIIAARLLGDIGSNRPMKEIVHKNDMDERAFAYAFKKRHGLPPKQWLIRERIKQAREILTSTHDWVCLKSLSAKLGFSSPSRFGVFYKKSYGETPRHTLRLRQAMLRKKA